VISAVSQSTASLMRLKNCANASIVVAALSECSPDTVATIDHVRQIGNIGAHMEANINVIVDVDPTRRRY
jgi:hypothetical protein